MLTGGVERLNFASAGLPRQGAGCDHPVRPHHQDHRRRHGDSRRERQHDARRGRPAAQLQARRQGARAGGARISGDAKSAFPDGLPARRRPSQTPDAARTRRLPTSAAPRARRQGAPRPPPRRRLLPRRKPRRRQPRLAQARRIRKDQRRRGRRHRLPQRPVLGRGAGVPGPAGGDPQLPQRRFRARRAGEPLRLGRADLAARPRHQRPALRAGRRPAARRRGALPQQGAGADRAGCGRCRPSSPASRSRATARISS